jgi:hypothetical protein
MSLILRNLQARSSGGERYLDAVEVRGSNPLVPTIFILFRGAFTLTPSIEKGIMHLAGDAFFLFWGKGHLRAVTCYYGEN